MVSNAGPTLSVVVATYNRPALVERLMHQLADQDLDRAEYEVIVVDDGSAEPVKPRLEALALPCALRVESQENAGAAAARHRGVMAARGEIVVIVDDDMQVGRGFLSAHMRAHPPGSRRAVLGSIRPPPDVAEMPLFERWHQKLLESFAERARSGKVRLRGNQLYTANLSFRRADYAAVGGFDQALERSEDAEFGLRLEQAGVEIGFSDEAATINGSDHTLLDTWRGRAFRYGKYDAVIARKHAGMRHASPWHYLDHVHPLSPPLMIAPSLVPPLARVLGGAAFAGASVADRLGLENLAYVGTGLTYGIDYFRGLRAEMGGAGMLLDLVKYLAKPERAASGVLGRAQVLARFVADVEADHQMSAMYDTKYGKFLMRGRYAKDVVQKIGLQMMLGVRLMRLFRDAGLPLAAKVVSRTMRHLYASDIHWDAEFAPGVVIAHGYALGISGGVRIGPGCIILHGASLGMGIDPTTREIGEPTLERNVHVGPHAMIFGPITIGEGSKIQSGALVTQSLPPNSVAWTPQPTIKGRVRNGSAAPRMQKPAVAAAAAPPLATAPNRE